MANAHSVARIEAERRQCSRFLYLAADPTDRVVKFGMSERPERRVAELVIGACHVLPNAEMRRQIRVALVKAWPLGVLARSAAVSIEYSVHRKLAGIAAFSNGEWYRLAAREAVALVDEFMGVATAATASTRRKKKTAA